jgi:hypothetical protein
MSEEEQYQRVASKNDLQEGGLLKVWVKDKELVLSWLKERCMLWITYAPIKKVP